MRAVVLQVGGTAATLMTIATLGAAQTRSSSITPSGTGSAGSVSWSPMPPMIAPSLAVGERIVLKDRNFTSGIEADPNGSYFLLEKTSATTWGRRPLALSCVNMSGVPCPFTTFKTTTGLCCKCIIGATLYPYPGAANVRALIDLSTGAKPSEILTLQEIGTLAAPASASPGPLQSRPQLGQSLALINNRKLGTLTQSGGWYYYVLTAGSQELARWPSNNARLLTDESLRLAILTSIGRHRSDNWGIPHAQLAK